VETYRVKVTVIDLIDRSLGFAVAVPNRSCSGRIREVSPFKNPWSSLATLFDVAVSAAFCGSPGPPSETS